MFALKFEVNRETGVQNIIVQFFSIKIYLTEVIHVMYRYVVNVDTDMYSHCTK